MRLDETVTLKLKADEAIVLGYFLSREIWNRGEDRLAHCIEHPAEAHALRSLLQELAPTLIQTGGPDADESNSAARDALLARYS